MVRRVGEMLRLETEARSVLIDAARLAGDRSVQKIPGVELESRLRRRDVEGTATRRIDDARGVWKRAARAVQYEVVVVSLAVLELLVIAADARADARRLPEVE